MISTILTRLGNLKIGRKLSAGFGIAVVVLVGLIAYSYTSLSRLAALQNEGASRAANAVRYRRPQLVDFARQRAQVQYRHRQSAVLFGSASLRQ